MSPKSPSPSPEDSNSRPRPATRQTRSDFYLEPNPFEESFKAPSASNVRNSSPQRDSNNSSAQDTRPDDPDRPQSRSQSRSSHQRSASPRPVLPPLASISSPADSSYSWGYNNNSINSLRSGPLSPAMLAGPQPATDQSHIGFDPANFRTGLTPRIGLTPRTGLTPGTGLTPLVGAFPASPGTAAFLAIMNGNNSTGAPSGATITPNTLNAISGVLNNSNSYQSSSLHHQTSANQDNPAATYVPTAANAASSAANGLFLLSQAHQELTKREEAQARASNTNSAAAATNGHVAATNGKRGAKRKSYDAMSPPPTSATTKAPGKRTRAASNGRYKASLRGASEDVDEEEDDGDDDDVIDGDEHDDPANKRSSKKPETEEEKRKNFLERNRQAALKCRQRKKAWLSQLQAKVEYLSQENERLTAALISSRDEISRLSALVGGAGVVGSIPTNGHSSSQPVSMNVTLAGKANGAAAVSGPGGGRSSGYGY